MPLENEKSCRGALTFRTSCAASKRDAVKGEVSLMFSALDYFNASTRLEIIFKPLSLYEGSAHNFIFIAHFHLNFMSACPKYTTKA